MAFAWLVLHTILPRRNIQVQDAPPQQLSHSKLVLQFEYAPAARRKCVGRMGNLPPAGHNCCQKDK